MASSLTIADAFRSSVGWLVPLFFGSIFSARLAIIALLSGFLTLLQYHIWHVLVYSLERGPHVGERPDGDTGHLYPFSFDERDGEWH